MENAIQAIQRKLGVSATGLYDAETHTAHLKAIGCVSCPSTATGWEVLLRGSFGGIAPQLVDALEEMALAFAKASLPVVKLEAVVSPVKVTTEPAVPDLVGGTPAVEAPMAETDAEPKTKRPRRK
jgi:hypothetical protein